MGFMTPRADSALSTERCRILIRDLQKFQSTLVNANRASRSPGKRNARTRDGVKFNLSEDSRVRRSALPGLLAKFLEICVPDKFDHGINAFFQIVF